MKIICHGGFRCHHCGTRFGTTDARWFLECDTCGSDNITNTLELNDQTEWEVTI